VKMSPALPQLSRAQLLEFVRGADVVVSMFHDRVDAEFLRAAGPQLKGVCNFAVGIDNFDLAACREAKVQVTNTPDAVTEGTANIAWALLLAVARRVSEGDRFVRAGEFEKQGNIFPTGWLGMHLTGQTMLIVGAGRIGRAVAMRAQAFGMRVMYTARSRHLDFEQAPLAAERVELEEGLRRADVVSLHTPLTPETRHLINSSRLAMMKRTAILINTARGPVVDEGALAAALKSRTIWGAGLDVFEQEPKVHPGLMALENVVMTPHIGSGERYWREEMTRMVCDNAGAILAGKRPPNLVG
jgi:glyoxylate reductase